eukprot:7210692-Ditylum_brightwellii.AAC.1
MMLWPYALKTAKSHFNWYDVDDEGISSGRKHTWGCPVYILDARLQDHSRSIPKWDPRLQLGNPESTSWDLPDDIQQVPKHDEPDHIEKVADSSVL